MNRILISLAAAGAMLLGNASYAITTTPPSASAKTAVSTPAVCLLSLLGLKCSDIFWQPVVSAIVDRLQFKEAQIVRDAKGRVGFLKV